MQPTRRKKKAAARLMRNVSQTRQMPTEHGVAQGHRIQ
jgi:hypothetical protein